ncbi:unnamed protein product [Ostreobium quekettii]|uniref:CID domain-containing protein n=1 Tax=Ostreobium quekettii TaxID=121088 RepID=A0A8S1JC77_9CHLO|nr:unnamed protein product [Ostreobium quekettii]
MGWARESIFQDLLEHNSRKLSKDGLDTLANIAVVDEFECYKHVAALLERQMRKGKDKQRINVLHVLSHILRRSSKKHGQKDKYAKRLEGRLMEIGKLLGECPAEQRDKVQKVVEAWRREKIFSKATLDALGQVLRQSISTAKTARPVAVKRPPHTKSMADAKTPHQRAEKPPPSPGSSAVESTAAPAGDGNEMYDPYRDAATGAAGTLPVSIPPVPVPPPAAPPPAPASHRPQVLVTAPSVPPAPIVLAPPQMCYGGENPYNYSQYYPAAPSLPPMHHAAPVPPPSHISVPPHLLNPPRPAPLPPPQPPPPPAPPALPPGMGPREPHGFKPPPPQPPQLPPPPPHKDLPPGLGPLPSSLGTKTAAPVRKAVASSSASMARKRSEEASKLEDVAPTSKRPRSSRWGPPSCSQSTGSKAGRQGLDAKECTGGAALRGSQQRADSSSGPQGANLGKGQLGAGTGDGLQRPAVKCDVNALIEKARGLAAAMVRQEQGVYEVADSNVHMGPTAKHPSPGGASQRPVAQPAADDKVDDGGSADMSLGQSGEVATEAAVCTEPNGPERGAEEVTSTLKVFKGESDGGKEAAGKAGAPAGDLGTILGPAPPMPPSSLPAPPLPLPPPPSSLAPQASCSDEFEGGEAVGGSGQDSQSSSPQGTHPLRSEAGTEKGTSSAKGLAFQP